jgi:dihydroorotate dehydrogenase electron transfer subunit
LPLTYAQVIESTEVAPGICLLRALAPDIVSRLTPGQFLHVRAGESADPLLRRPFSVHRYNRASGEFSLLFRCIGRGTEWLGRKQPGDLLDVLGPLGNGFHLRPNTKNLLLLAGGLGVASLTGLMDEAVAQGMAVTLVMGARCAEGIYPQRLVPAEVEYQILTEDGCVGRKGLITDVIPELAPWADQVCACGPKAMLRTIAMQYYDLLRDKDVLVAMEELMACGVGACLSCVIETKHGLQRTCVDGPIFRMRDIVW